MFALWILARAPCVCFSSLCQMGFELYREERGWRETYSIGSFIHLFREGIVLKFLLAVRWFSFSGISVSYFGKSLFPTPWSGYSALYSEMPIGFMLAHHSTIFPWPQWLIQSWTYSQAGPVMVFIGIPVWASGKEVLLPLALVNQESVSPKCCVAILSTMWREPVWEWSQEEAIRSEGWREGTDLIIFLLYWTYQPRLALSHTENPLLDWWLVMNSIQNQLHLLLTWFELDICHLHIPQNITYVPGKWLGTILSWSPLIQTASTGMREHCPHFTDREYHSHFTEVQRAVRTHPCSHE